MESRLHDRDHCSVHGLWLCHDATSWGGDPWQWGLQGGAEVLEVPGLQSSIFWRCPLLEKDNDLSVRFFLPNWFLQMVLLQKILLNSLNLNNILTIHLPCFKNYSQKNKSMRGITWHFCAEIKQLGRELFASGPGPGDCSRHVSAGGHIPGAGVAHVITGHGMAWR